MPPEDLIINEQINQLPTEYVMTPEEQELKTLKEINSTLQATRRNKALQLQEAQLNSVTVDDDLIKERYVNKKLEDHILDLNGKLSEFFNPLSQFDTTAEVVMIENNRRWEKISSSDAEVVFAQIKNGVAELSTNITFYPYGKDLRVQFERIGYTGIVRNVIQLPDGNLQVSGLYRNAEITLIFELIETK